MPWICASAKAATYYVDPASGSMANAGTAAKPWSTLEAVFAANKTFAPGDLILLKSGYHGAPALKGNNTGFVTIRPAEGARPKLKTLTARSASRWVISGLDICPENEAMGTFATSEVVEFFDSCSYITFQDCFVRSAFDTSTWTVSNWQDQAANGIRTAARYTILSGNRFENVAYGIRVRKTSTNTLVSRNTVKGFCMDGIVALGDDCIYEYNTISGSYVADSNHDDLFQSWTTNTAGAIGGGTISRVTVRGNIFISRTDPNQPLSTEPQGIGCFDGVFQDWVIENNLVVSNTFHGISLYGAVNCKIVNNTVVQNPLNTSSNSRPWIQIYQHGDYVAGGTFPPASSGNLIRNNITANTAIMVAGGGTMDHNQKTNDYTAWFTNYPAFDLTLKPTAPGVGAGEAANAPSIDLRELPRTLPYDIGAYEIQSAAQDPYQQWLVANGLPPDGTGLGAPNAVPNGDGVPNELKFALGLPGNSAGYAGRLSTGTISVSNQTFLTLTYVRPDPAPAGATYAVEVGNSLEDWSATPTVEVRNRASGGLRTIVVRDTVPIPQGGRRFIRLNAEK